MVLLLGCKRASERVAALLLMLAQRLKPPNGATTAKPLPPLIELPLSRADIAEYLGLRLETVSRQLNRLEAAGVIKRCDRRGIALVQRRRARAPVGRSLPRAALTLSGPPSLPRSGATPASAWPQRGPASAITVYLGPITKARLCRI
jgi:DNA-binding transcriptional ArsR family regulator